MVPHFLVVVEARYDGLSGAAWVRRHKTTDLLLHPFKPSLFLTALSTMLSHGANITVNGYERIAG